MITLDIIEDGRNLWKKSKRAKLTSIARIPKHKGHSTVEFKITLPTGEVVIAETTLRLLENAVTTFLITESS